MLNQIEMYLRQTVIPQLAGAVISGKAISSQFRITGGSGNQFPIWIDICNTTMKDGHNEVAALHARTNDMDFMVGYPPSFYTTRKATDEKGLADDIVAYLNTKLDGLSRIEVLLRATAAQGVASLPILVGDSDSGVIGEQPVFEGL